MVLTLMSGSHTSLSVTCLHLDYLLLNNFVYIYPISLEGKWDFEVVRFSVHYYYYPISLEGKWDFEVVRFSVHYYYTCS